MRAPSQALVELGLVLPVVLMMLLGLIDLGRAFVYGVAVQQGARESARLAATASLDSTVTDSVVLQRLLLASAPAVGDCAPTLDTPQNCGGGTWTFTMRLAPTSGGTTYSSLAAARGSQTNISGYEVELTARGTVSTYSGFVVGLVSYGLSHLTIQGDAVMEVV
jgi:Flp pilus assembly protein TadG